MWPSSVSALAPTSVSQQGFKKRHSLISIQMDIYPISCKNIVAVCGRCWFSQISQWPSAWSSSCRRQKNNYLADNTLQALGRALSWKDLFSLEIGSAFLAIIWSFLGTRTFENLPAWWEHMDFYSGLSIITNQACDFGQIIWPLLHLSFLICLLE